MKKLLFLLLAMLLPMMASAQERFGWICYEKKADGTYKVVKPDYYITGETIIPSTVNGIKVTEIGDDAFYNQKVTVVHLPITIERIGARAFNNCDRMWSFEIPENVKYIGANALGDNDNLTDVYCYANNLSLGEDIFNKTKVKNITLHVPEANFLYFKKADQWKKIKNLEATTKRSWAVEQNEREIAEQKRIAEEREREAKRIAEEREREAKRIAEEQAKARQELINDSTMAMQGNADAQLRMAKRYENGDGVVKDVNEAIELYKKLADQGNVEAQLRLGDIYLNGIGVDMDGKIAIGWYRKAAELGNADAQYNLGTCYYYGYGTAKDEKTAMIWTKKAAAQGHSQAKSRQMEYEKNHSSYWKNNKDWRIIYPDGVIVVPTEEHDRGAKTNNFIVQFPEDFYSKDDFEEVASQKRKIHVWRRHPIHNIYLNDKNSFIALSNKEQSALLKKELSHFLFQEFEITIEDLGYFRNGKFVTEEEAQAAAQKALDAKLASFTKRFGFNPDGKGAKQLITYGRSLSLLTEWYYFRKEHQLSYYFFNLHQDLGSQKCYGIYYAKDYYSNNGKRQGYIWVKGGRITSVEWR